MKILSVLRFVGKTALKIAGVAVPEVAAKSNPLLGTIVGVALRGILHAEARHGAGKGEEKMQDALAAVDASLPAIIQVAETVTGKDLVDDAQFANSMKLVVEGMVGVMNSFRILPKG